uniref:Uncharacterized protein n=1 Tax=Cacopsylla melanoneura TaxID=428564 RepID=A0A8D8UXG4_9HEMI
MIMVVASSVESSVKFAFLFLSLDLFIRSCQPFVMLESVFAVCKVLYHIESLLVSCIVEYILYTMQHFLIDERMTGVWFTNVHVVQRDFKQFSDIGISQGFGYKLNVDLE